MAQAVAALGVRYSNAVSTRVFIVALAIAGLTVFIFAKNLSDFEKRLKDAHPSTKVTGWSGTEKGVLAWRCVGVLIGSLEWFVCLGIDIEVTTACCC
jgi:hypothetical protein